MFMDKIRLINTNKILTTKNILMVPVIQILDMDGFNTFSMFRKRFNIKFKHYHPGIDAKKE